MYIYLVGEGIRVRTALVTALKHYFLAVRVPCFPTKAAGEIALTTPNLDELAAMALAAEENTRASEVQTGSTSSLRASLLRNGSVSAVGTALTEGHSLAQAAIADGQLVDARPLGPSLTAVLAAMLKAGVRPASNGEGGGFGERRTSSYTFLVQDCVCAGNYIAVPPKHRARAQTAVRRVRDALLSVPAEPQSTQVALPYHTPRICR